MSDLLIHIHFFACQAMDFLTDVNKKQKAQKTSREKELEKVVVAKEDMDVVVCFASFPPLPNILRPLMMVRFICVDDRVSDPQSSGGACITGQPREPLRYTEGACICSMMVGIIGG